MATMGDVKTTSFGQRWWGTLATGWLDHLTRLQATARERRALQGLNDHALKDIGLNRGDVEREANRAIWDITRR